MRVSHEVTDGWAGAVVGDFGFDIFPSGVLGGDGRRLRPGSRVQVEVEGKPLIGEITGWAGRRGIEVSFDGDPWMMCLSPVELTRVDEYSDDVMMAGVTIIDPDPIPTAIVVPLGGRDFQRREELDGQHPEFERLLAEAPSSRPGSGSDLRTWSTECLEELSSISVPEQQELVYRLFDMPMLRRVLDEAVLPSSVEVIIPVVTDQDQPQQSDTVSLLPLMSLWLSGRGHIGVDEPMVRPVGAIADAVRVSRLPFQLDAVVHQVSQDLRTTLARFEGVVRAIVVLAGGTPAMMYGSLIAAGSVLGEENVISVQVPLAWIVQGRPVMQALVEMSLADSALAVRNQDRE